MENNIIYSVEIQGIKWDGPKKQLPKNISFEISHEELVEMFGEFDNTNNNELDEVIGNYAEDKISDDTGFCHNGWSSTEIKVLNRELELSNDRDL